MEQGSKIKKAHPSTVGRGRRLATPDVFDISSFIREGVRLDYGDALDHYGSWDTPTTIVSDGGYGILGFDGDTSDHMDLPKWYEPHVAAWSQYAKPSTSLWFWNSEIGWAAVHPILERYGWRYVQCCVWDKGMGHVAGNVNTAKIRRFPVVTEVCALYVREPRMNGAHLKEWLLSEWARSGLPLAKANEACGVRDAAVRKYLDQGHLWYFPPPDRFKQLSDYANANGAPEGRPYFSQDGCRPVSESEWGAFRAKFTCPHGWTNVWHRPPLSGAERLKAPQGRSAHLNQKPLDLMRLIIEATTDAGDVVWEPFGGLFTGALASLASGRRCHSSEIEPAYFERGVARLREVALSAPLL